MHASNYFRASQYMMFDRPQTPDARVLPILERSISNFIRGIAFLDWISVLVLIAGSNKTQSLQSCYLSRPVCAIVLGQIHSLLSLDVIVPLPCSISNVPSELNQSCFPGLLLRVRRMVHADPVVDIFEVLLGSFPSILRPPEFQDRCWDSYDSLCHTCGGAACI